MSSLSILWIASSVLACGDDAPDDPVAPTGTGGSTSSSTGGTGGTGGGADVAIACGESGVTVRGTVTYEGAVDAGAKGYINFADPADGFPTCFIEFTPDTFPLTFEFTAVPDEAWQLQAYIDLDGGFPPVPTSGDPIDRLDAAELDLSADVADILFELEPMP